MSTDVSIAGLNVLDRPAWRSARARAPTTLHSAPGWHGVVAWGAWFCLAILLLAGGERHEPWFDEAQAWLIAQNSDPVQIVTHLVRYEGTPALWHLLLWAVQRLGLPYSGLYLVSAASALLGAWLVLFRSPFPIWMRVGAIFSYFFAYQYAVVARSYALDLTLFPLIGCLFERRAERPLVYGLVLGLLANTNAHSFIVSLPLALDFAWACWRRPTHARGLGGIGLYGGMCLAAVFQAWPPNDPQFQSAGGIEFMAARPVILLLEGLVDRANPFQPWSPGLHVFSSGLLITQVILIPAGLLARKAGRLTLSLAMLGALEGFFLFVYSNYWHSGIVFLVLLLSLWINWAAMGSLRRDHRVWLLMSCAILLIYQASYTVGAWAQDLRGPYSAGRSAAAELAELRAAHPSARIAAAGFKTLSVEPYFAATPFKNTGPERFYRWRRGSGAPLYATPAVWASLTRSRSYDWLLLSTDTRVHDFDLPRSTAVARLSGYCLSRVFPGQLVWKTRVAEPDTLALFGPCAHGPRERGGV